MVKRVWTEEQKNDIITLFKNGMTFKQLQDKYNAHYSSIKTVLVEAGVDTNKRRRWTEEQIQDIIHKFTKESWTIQQLKKHYITHSREITKILQDAGIDTSYYICRQVNRNVYNDFFEVIDTEEKAYILGLLMADGCVMVGKGNKLNLSLELIDLDVIQKVQKALNSDSKVTVSNRNRAYIKNERTTYTISIFSDKLCRDLGKYGIVPNKTVNTDWLTTDIPSHLRRHYLRGLIDGDGHISIDSKGKWTIGLTNNHVRFLGEVALWIEELTGVSPLTIGKTTTSHRIAYTGKKAKRIIYELYHDNSISMDRKQILADQAVKDIV